VSPNPVDDPELYDSVVLGGVRSPGKATLSGHDRVVGWDVKEGSGQNGATMTRKGERPVEFTLTLYLADQDDFDAWPAFVAVVDGTVAGSTPKAVDIYHPDLASQGITSVVKASVGGTVHDGKGGQTIAIKLTEYRPPKPATGSPAGSSSKKPAAVDPNQSALDEIAKLTQQYQQSPWGGPTVPVHSQRIDEEFAGKR
jgi:hypothetical protein